MVTCASVLNRSPPSSSHFFRQERYLRPPNSPKSSDAPLVRPASIEDRATSEPWSGLLCCSEPVSSRSLPVTALRDLRRASRSRAPKKGAPEPIVGVPSLVTALAERSSVVSLACVIFLIFPPCSGTERRAPPHRSLPSRPLAPVTAAAEGLHSWLSPRSCWRSRCPEHFFRCLHHPLESLLGDGTLSRRATTGSLISTARRIIPHRQTGPPWAVLYRVWGKLHSVRRGLASGGTPGARSSGGTERWAARASPSPS